MIVSSPAPPLTVSIQGGTTIRSAQGVPTIATLETRGPSAQLGAAALAAPAPAAAQRTSTPRTPPRRSSRFLTTYEYLLRGHRCARRGPIDTLLAHARAPGDHHAPPRRDGGRSSPRRLRRHRRNPRPAPSPQDFPSAKGKTISQLLHDSGATPSKLVVAPASQVFDTGAERYPFGVFTPGQEQVEDVEVALYFAKDGKSKVLGPLPGEAGNAADQARLPLPERLRPGRGEVGLRGAEGRLRPRTAPGWRSR